MDTTLAPEIIVNICFYLNVSSLLALSCVNKTLHAVCADTIERIIRYLSCEKPVPAPLLMRFRDTSRSHVSCPDNCYAKHYNEVFIERKKTCSGCFGMESIMCDVCRADFHSKRPELTRVRFCAYRRDWYVAGCVYCESDPDGVYASNWTMLLSEVSNAQSMIQLFIRHGYGNATMFSLPRGVIAAGLECAKECVDSAEDRIRAASRDVVNLSGVALRNFNRDILISARGNLVARAALHTSRYGLCDALIEYLSLLVNIRGTECMMLPLLTPDDRLANSFVDNLEFVSRLSVTAAYFRPMRRQLLRNLRMIQIQPNLPLNLASLSVILLREFIALSVAHTA